MSAGEAIVAYASEDLHVRYKTDQTLVTEADLASEKIIITNIKESFTEDYIYSEESGCNLATALTTSSYDDNQALDAEPDWHFKTRKPGDHVWIIDPLDGTTNFANSYPFYCVSVAVGQVEENGHIEPLAGGIHNPVDKSTFLAYRHGGAYHNDKKVAVAANRDFADSFLASGFCHQKGEALAECINTFFKVASEVSSLRKDGASALDLALVARGTYDCFWEEGIKPWDVAAGCLLVMEAGGIVRNYHSTSPVFDMEGGNIIAGNAVAVSRIQKFLN